MEKLLAVFEVNDKRYSIYGDYTIEKGQDLDLNHYDYPEFCQLTAKEVLNGKEIDFTPSGETWAGRKYVVDDMIQDFIAKQIQNSKLYTAIYLDEGLQQLVKSYHEDIVDTINDLEIPKKILSSDMYDLYELLLVTSAFIYYAHYDELLMLRTDTHEVVSDNYFASVGYYESIENIKANSEEETHIWGEIPEE